MLTFILIQENVFKTTLLYGFAISVAIQAFYFLFFYIRIFFSDKKKIVEPKLPPISVIIAAKNEEENLRQFLPFILNQQYPNFEVIVVNDCSCDGSELLLNQFKEKHKNLYVTNIHADEKYTHGKKLAISVGIKAAKNEILLFTDADCKPLTNKWIHSFAEKYDPATEIILGYGRYKTEKGFLNKIIRYETLFTAIQYLTFAHAGVPYMGVGRNLSYRKSLWIKNKGFASHAHILSGDDDLFVNANANKRNTKLIYSHKSTTVSIPQTKFSKLKMQKQRHFQTGKKYRFIHKVLLGLEIFSRTLFYLLAIFALLYSQNKELIVGLIIFREILMLTIVSFSAKKFKEKGISIFILIFDFLVPVINLLIVVFARIRKKKVVWK